MNFILAIPKALANSTQNAEFKLDFLFLKQSVKALTKKLFSLLL
jgi:hypothetical protein